MSTIEIRGPFSEVALQPVDPGPDRDTIAFVLLPSLEELLATPGFGLQDAICLPGTPRPFDGWALFGAIRDRGLILQ